MTRVGRIARATLMSAVLAGVGVTGLTLAPASSAAAAARPAATCYPIGSSNCGGSIQAPPFASRGLFFVVRVGGYVANSKVTFKACGIRTITTTANSGGAALHRFNVPISYPLGPCKVVVSGTGDNTRLYLTTTVVIRKVPSNSFLGLRWLGLPGRFSANVYVRPIVHGIPPKGRVAIIAWNRFTRKILHVCSFILKAKGYGFCRFVLPRGHYLVHAAYGGDFLFAASRSFRLPQSAR